MRTIIVAVVLVLMAPHRAATQETASAHRMPMIPANVLTRPIDLMTGIGKSHDAVTGATPEPKLFTIRA